MMLLLIADKRPPLSAIWRYRRALYAVILRFRELHFAAAADYFTSHRRHTLRYAAMTFSR